MSCSSKSSIAIALGLVLLLWPCRSNGDAALGALSGEIVDPSGSVVANARVIVRGEADGTERRVETDASGGFLVGDLPPGRYQMIVESTMFAANTVGFSIVAGERRNLRVTVQLPVVAEALVVVALIAGGPETVRHIPGAVGVLDRETIEKSHVLTTNELLRKVAGVHVREEEGFGLRPNIGIRGLNPTRSSKVLLLEDGIPLTYAPYGDNASYYHPPVDRFETIEVLKGSGQIAYGPSTVGGVVNYVTPAPPRRPGGTAAFAMGSRDYLNGHLRLGGTWNQTGVLLDVMRKQKDGSRENTHSELNDVTIKLTQTVGSRHFVSLKGNYYGEDSTVTYSGLRESEYRENPRQNPFENDTFGGQHVAVSLTHTFQIRPDMSLATNVYNSHFDRDWWRQSSNSGQRPNDSADSRCGGMANLNTTCGNEGRLRRYALWGVEPRLRFSFATGPVRHHADAGFRAHFESQYRRQENGDTPLSRRGALVEHNRRLNDAYAVFVQDRIPLGRWAVMPGVRVEHIGFDRTNYLASNGQGATGTTSLTQVIPGLGVSYSRTPAVTVFAGLHRGFAPPRTEDVISNTGGVVDLDPELSWNSEVGIRTSGRGVQMEAAAFQMSYENQIIPTSLAGGIGATLTNAGRTLHRGAEASGRFDAGRFLRWRHDPYVRVAYTWLPTARFAGARFSSVSGFQTTSVAGNRLPYAPGHLLAVTIGYEHPSGLDLALEAVRVGSQFGDDLNVVEPTPDGQRGLISGYTVWNAAASYTAGPMGYFVAVKNATNGLFIVDRARGILPGPPREVQAGVKLRF